MKMFRMLVMMLVLTTLNVQAVLAAAWKTCDGVTVKPKYQPMGIFWDLCSMPDGSPAQRAFRSAMNEVRNYVHSLGFGGGYNGQCLIEHDNDRSDTALVNRADIDGRLGLTLIETDCEDIITADVMAAADLNFTRADESRVIREAPAGTVIGALVILHEVGHALGLEHTSSFTVMRMTSWGPAPFVGMLPGSGGLSSELTGDDVFGISRIYGFTPMYRNVYVSSQALRAGGLRDKLIDNNVNPLNDDREWEDPLLACPGEVVNFLATVGNNSTTVESFNLSVYLDPNVNAYPGGLTGALTTVSVSMGQGTTSFPIQFTVPASLAANTTYYVFVGTSNSLLTDRKGYDNTARSALRIRRNAGC